MCDGEDGATVEQRIAGCTAVIKAAKGENKGDKLAEAFELRGAAYRNQGEFNLAIADYNQAIKLNPKFAQAYHNRGVAYDHKGDFDRAIQDFDQAIKLKPSALAHFNRGNAYLGKNQYDQAVDDYNQAIRLKPDFAAAFDNRCWARAVAGVLKQALADCNAALRLSPEQPGHAGEPRFHLSEDDEFRRGSFRLRGRASAQSVPGRRALRPGLGEAQERGRHRRGRHRCRQGNPGRHRRGIRPLRYERNALGSGR